MKTLLKKCAALAAAAAVSISSFAAFAEGSKELTAVPENVPTGQAAYRPYLEWRDRTQFGMESENVFYVYARQGETVQLATNVSKASDFSIAAIVEHIDTANGATRQYEYGSDYYRITTNPGITVPDAVKGASIAVTLPTAENPKTAVVPDASSTFAAGSAITNAAAGTNTIYMFKPDDTKGLIKTRAQELAGPNAEGGYTPITFTAPVTGTYSVRFLSSDYGAYDNPNRPASKTEGGKIAGTKVTDFWNDASSASVNSVETAALSEVPEDTTGATPDPTATPEPTPTPTPEPTPAPTVMPVVYNPSDYIWEDEQKAEVPKDTTVVREPFVFYGETSIREDRFFSGNKAFATEDDFTKAAALPTNRMIKYTPPANGQITINAKSASNEQQKRILMIVNEERTEKGQIVSNNSSDEKTLELSVTKGEPLYIFSIIGGVQISNITFIPDNAAVTNVTVQKATNDNDLNSSFVKGGAGEGEVSVTGMIQKKDTWLTADGSGNGCCVSYTPAVSGRLRVKACASAGGNSIGTVSPEERQVTIQQGGSSSVSTVHAADATVTPLTEDENLWTDWAYVKADKPVQIWSRNRFNFFGLEFVPTGEEVLVKEILPGSATAEANGEWIANDATVAAFDISVVGADGNTVKNGRVWSDILFMNMGNHGKGIFSKVNVLTEDGFLYNVDFNGMQPYSFVFYSNNRGFLQNTWNRYDKNAVSPDKSMVVPLEHSFYSSTTSGDVGEPAPEKPEEDSNGEQIFVDGKEVKSGILGNYVPVDENKDATHKLFLNEPDDDALNVLTDNKGYKKEEENDKSLLCNAVVSYEGQGSRAESKDNIQYGTVGVGGIFHIDLTKSDVKNALSKKDISIILNFSKYALDANRHVILQENGEWAFRDNTTTDENIKEYERNNIVTLTATVDGSKTYELVWDGKDAYGNDVPPGIYGESGEVIKTCVEMGAAHFPLLDVEFNPNGFKIHRVNAVDTDTRNKVYYNNFAVSPSIRRDTTNWYFKEGRSGFTYTGAYKVDDNDVEVAAKDSDKGVFYPYQIGDGRNRLGGIDSSNGAMQYGNYEHIYDNTLTAAGDTVTTTESARAKQASISDNQQGYGNFAALDTWSKYSVEQTISGLTIGVNPDTTDAYVSFVASNVTTDITNDNTAKETFKQSHIAKATGANEVSPTSAPIRRETSARGDASNGDKIFGNTISTGFFSKVVTTTNASDVIKWEITIPASDTVDGQSYVKVPDSAETAVISQADVDEQEYIAYELYRTLLEENAISVGGDDAEADNIGDDINSETTELGEQSGVVSTDDTDSIDTAIGDEPTIMLDSVEVSAAQAGDYNIKAASMNVETTPILTDAEGVKDNKGKIYKINSFTAAGTDGKITLRLSHKLPTTITGGATIVAGIVIDNLYAPGATAKLSHGAVGEYINIDAVSIQSGSTQEYKDQYNRKIGKDLLQ